MTSDDYYYDQTWEDEEKEESEAQAKQAVQSDCVYIICGRGRSPLIRICPCSNEKGWIHIDDIYRLISGHSNYHGDNILSALTCLAEGKKVTSPIKVLDMEGEWKFCRDRAKEGHISCYECSECGNFSEGDSNFCSNCGANMRGDEE